MTQFNSEMRKNLIKKTKISKKNQSKEHQKFRRVETRE
jgi:hypothetical protein